MNIHQRITFGLFDDELPFMRFYKGGGGTPPTPAPAAPVAKATSAEAEIARRDSLEAARKRQGMRSTLLSGDNADFWKKSEQAAGFGSGGKSTLLGG